LHSIRQSRGYNFEYKIVNELNNGDWQCRRMGGSSANNPDEIATYNEKGVIVVIEAKSTVGKYAYMPVDQILRFKEILHMFHYYPRKFMMFAWKFSKGKGAKPKYYYHIFEHLDSEELELFSSIRCDDKGMLMPVLKDKRKYLNSYSFYYYMWMVESLFDVRKDLEGRALIC
jgi:Holliday junction resolvase